MCVESAICPKACGHLSKSVRFWVLHLSKSVRFRVFDVSKSVRFRVFDVSKSVVKATYMSV